MPLIQIHTSAEPPTAERQAALLRELSKTLARELGKPEQYMMTCLAPRAAMSFGGTAAPACFAQITNIGELSEALTARLSSVVCRLLCEGLGVAHERIYLEFRDIEPHLWGFDGGTFA
jgi:phenylpyruvate tautomerase PptA (4-oxalocrotonate tautomerase family)